MKIISTQLKNKLATAIQNQKKNNFETAEKQFKQVLNQQPNNFNALYYLGTLYAQTRKLNLAKNLLLKANEINPNVPALQMNLGNIHLENGLNDEAINYYENAIKTQPTLVQAHFNLGVINSKIGNLTKAISCYEMVIRIKPDDTKSYNNLAIIYKEQKNYNKAIELFKEGIRKNPKDARLYVNLASTNSLIGQFENSIKNYLKAISLDSNNVIAINGLIDLLKSFKFTDLSEKNIQTIKNLFIFLYSKKDIDHSSIFHNAKLFTVAYNKQLELQNTLSDKNQILSNYLIKDILNDDIFILILQNSLILDRFLERFLTQLRKTFLYEFYQGERKLLEVHLSFLAALAEQSYLNEYVFFQTEEEIKLIKILEEKIINNKKINEIELVLLASYRPLYSNKNLVDKLMNHKSKNNLVNDMLNLQINEPLVEKTLVKSIKNVDNITDEISKKVREQYEENPYPRWRYADQRLSQNFLVQLNNDLKPKTIKFNKSFSNPSILIAGCGTGKQVIKALSYQNAKIIAVDLSLASLSYAKICVKEINKLENVEFIQGDILQLKKLGKKFDVIESVGVIHHMKNPQDGLKVLLDLLEPHGFLKLGLYSELARKHIVKIREFIAKEKLTSSILDIRKVRELIMSNKDNNLFQKLTFNHDFYSTSSTRDLIFHVQEHRFTIPKIKKMINDFNLEFLGFTGPLIKQKYLKNFPNDTNCISLDNWDKFENDNQDAFIGMYQFWVKKK